MRFPRESAVALQEAAGWVTPRSRTDTNGSLTVPTPSLLALVDPDSDLLAGMRDTGRAVVQLLTWGDRQLAEAFAGTAPAPGGPFRQAEFVATPHGPLLASATTHAFLSLASERVVGWSVEVEAVLDAVTVDETEQSPLLHHRGRFQPLPE